MGRLSDRAKGRLKLLVVFTILIMLMFLVTNMFRDKLGNHEDPSMVAVPKGATEVAALRMAVEKHTYSMAFLTEVKD